MTDLRDLIDAACDGPLARAQAGRAFAAFFDGTAADIEIAAFLAALRTRGETVEEIAAAAAAMRDRMHRITAPADAMDIVGTGGDGKGTLNISTATAFVVAGAGVPVAKHGNRNLSSQSGAADVLSASGVAVQAGPDGAQRALDETGICFMMAPQHHPAIGHVMPVRTGLGIRTIFNILGPLTNPAGVTRQLTGAYSRHLIRPMAEVLRDLGADTAWLVHGGDGTDELSIAGPSAVAVLADGAVEEREITPDDAGLPTHPFEALLGGTPQQNAAALAALLDGEGGAYRDAVLLNAAAALVVAGKVQTLPDGAQMAATAIDSGAARDKLAALARITREAAA